MSDEKIWMSASKLDVLDQCGLRYYLQSVVKAPVVETKNVYAAFGTAFHKCAEIMYEDENFERSFLLDQWSEQFSLAMKDPQIEKIDPVRKQTIKQQGYPLLQKFFSTEQSHGLLKKAVALEKKFQFPLMEVDGVTVMVTGYIDRIINKNGKAEVGDYKTSQSMEITTPKELLKTIQLPLYSIAYRRFVKKFPRIFKHKEHIISLYYVRYAKKIQAVVTKEDRINLKKRIRRIVRKALNKEFEPNRGPKSVHCKWCTFKGICPAYGKKLPDFSKIKKENEKKKANKEIDLGKFKREWKRSDGKLMKIKDYQVEDVIHMAEHKLVLNANQVGTGKTVESIALMEHIKTLKKKAKGLLILPKTLADQWQEEILDWSGRKSTSLIELGRDKRKDLYGKTTWTITNNEKIISDVREVTQIPWDIIYVDEAQRIGGKADSARIIRDLPAQYRIPLSGTPIGSKLERLFRIVSFVKPGILGTWTYFKNRHIEYDDKTGKIKKYKNLKEIRDRLGPHIIRRKKKDILAELEEPFIIPVMVEMSRRQKAIYNEEIEELQKMVDEEGSSESNIVNFLDTPAGGKYIRIRTMLDCIQAIDPDSPFDSPKFDEMLNIIDPILSDGGKVIIFTQFLRIAKIIRRELKKTYSKVMKITGDENNTKRTKARKLFNKSPNHNLLVMTDAGKFGLNLQGGSNMINFETPEDPEVVTQRIGRIHRPGQDQGVTVWNFITKGTIEEKIHKKRHLKAQLSKVIIDEESDLDEIDFDEIKNIMSVADLKEILI